MDEMKRISIVGLCLVAMVAFGAMAVSSAYAGEFITCTKTKAVKEGKTKHYTGSYKNAECTEAEVNGEYESAAATGTTFTSTTGAAVLESAAGNISCKKSKGTGEITGLTTDTEIITFETCTLSLTKGKCTSTIEGTKEGNIISYSDTTLIDNGQTGPSGGEPASGEVWDSFAPTGGEPFGEYQAIYVCAPGIIFRTAGSTSGVVGKPSTKESKAGTVVFGKSGGEQDLETEYSENGGETWNPTGPNTENASGKVKYDKDVEVRAKVVKPIIEYPEGVVTFTAAKPKTEFQIKAVEWNVAGAPNNVSGLKAGRKVSGNPGHFKAIPVEAHAAEACAAVAEPLAEGNTCWVEVEAVNYKKGETGKYEATGTSRFGRESRFDELKQT
jgi:hypothetical protein